MDKEDLKNHWFFPPFLTDVCESIEYLLTFCFDQSYVFHVCVCVLNMQMKSKRQNLKQWNKKLNQQSCWNNKSLLTANVACHCLLQIECLKKASSKCSGRELPGLLLKSTKSGGRNMLWRKLVLAPLQRQPCIARVPNKAPIETWSLQSASRKWVWPVKVLPSRFFKKMFLCQQLPPQHKAWR